MRNIVILYHNDEDGFGAAWAAWKKFGNKADYRAVEYGAPPPKFLKGKEVYLLDFCYPEMVMKKVEKDNKRVVVVDHHITQKKAVETADDFSFSLKNSAAVLAWKYFHPQKALPKLSLYIEDIDLWRFKKKFTREIVASLDTYDFRFKIWDKISRDLENPRSAKKYITEGKAIIKYQNKLVEKLANNGVKVILDGQPAVAVNSPVLESEIGDCLRRNKKTMGVIWSLRNGRIEVSLRSDGRIDVSKIAQKFGGGGHRLAAGFAFNAKIKFPWSRRK
jgi:oligoribonuclease NrnB/cAMP/cGMP phosphodiesterase (DHH superfamily)